MRFIRLGAICLAVALTVTGCATQEEPQTSAVTKSAAPSGLEEKETEEQPLDPATCLEGTWLVDNEYFLAQYKDIGGSELTEVTGKVTQAFDASGGVVTVYDGWRIDSVTEGMATTITRTGTDRGTYTADGSIVTLNETDVGSELVVSAAGVEQVIAANAVSFTQAAYTCDATKASIAAPDGTANLTRID